LALGQMYWYAAGVGYLLVWPWIPGMWGAHMGTLLAGTPVFALQAHAGRTFARLYANLQEQFERFDVRSAAISFESDRTCICDSIEELFDGSLDNFNTKVRTTLKSAAMRSLTGQRAMIPYRGMLWQMLPGLPLFCSKFSTTIHLPFYYRVSYHFFGVTFVLCVLPVFSAAAMEFGKRVAAQTKPDGSGAAMRYVGVGVLFATALCVWAQLVWILPCWIGVGGMRSHGVEDWHSLLVAVPTNALAVVAAVWAFCPQSGIDSSGSAEAGGDGTKLG